MSEQSNNPLDGLPSPVQGAKPSPLNSESGHDKTGERWWLKNSLNPEKQNPELPNDSDIIEPSVPVAQESSALDASLDEDSAPSEDQCSRDDVHNAGLADETSSESKKPILVIAIAAVVFLVGFILMSRGE